MMHIKAGKPSVKSSKLISLMDETISKPTIIKAGAVAALGINVANGAKTNATRKSSPVVTAVRPVRPPSPIPAALSTYEVIVLVPISAPNETPKASTSIAFPIFGELPSLSINPALLAVPTKVPKVSNNSTKVKVNTTVQIPMLKAPLISSSKTARFEKSGRAKGEKPSAILVTPIGMPIRVVTMIPISNEPFTRIAINAEVITSPVRQSNMAGFFRLPRPMFHSKYKRPVCPFVAFKCSRVGGITLVETAMISESFRPITVMNNPIPTVIAIFSD